MRPSARAVALGLLVLTLVQLLVAVLVPGLSQFAGKNFAARLVAYPVLMLAVPVTWALATRAQGRAASVPWAAVAWLMAPFLIDVTGNTLDLYDRVGWWDDVNHLVNWFLLGVGVGLLLRRVGVGPPWVLGTLVAGLGAVLAIGWELGEWVTFIRTGTELDGAYTDTLADQALGTLGALLAAVVVATRSTRRTATTRATSPREGGPGRRSGQPR